MEENDLKIIVILRNVKSALQTLHIRGDEAKVFSSAIDALESVINALEQSEKEISAQYNAREKEETK